MGEIAAETDCVGVQVYRDHVRRLVVMVEEPGVQAVDEGEGRLEELKHS